jgi:hypothetical protein
LLDRIAHPNQNHEIHEIMLVVKNSCVRTTMLRRCSITTGHLLWRSALPRRRSVVSSPTSRTPPLDRQHRQLGTPSSASARTNNNNNGRRRGKLRETAEYEAFCRQQQQLRDQPAGGGVNNTKKSMPAPENKEQHWEPWEPIVYFGILPIVIWCGIIYFSPELRAQMYEHMEWQQPPDTVIAASSSRNDTDTATTNVTTAATDASTSE